MMKKLIVKKLLLIPCLALFAAAAAWAQPPHQKPDFSPLYEQWQLTDEQVQQLEGYFQQHHEAMRELREQNMGSRRENREAMKALMQQHRDNLAKVLSEDQLQELRQFAREQQRFRRDPDARPFDKRENNPANDA